MSEFRHRVCVASVCAGLLVLILGSGCSGSGASGPADLVHPGSWYVRERWPHDGRPYEGDRFVVFSDSANVDARRDVAELAERLWSQILFEMGIDSGMLSLPAGQEKIHIYAFQDRSPEWGGKAYHGGILISSPNRRSVLGLMRTGTERYEATFKHELVHVMTLAVLHSRGLDEPPWVPVWFFEGLAEVVRAGTGGSEIKGKDHFNYLTSRYGRLNPVSYWHDEDIEGGPGAFTDYHYPMRQLAVAYLFDEDGYNTSFTAATGLLLDMAGGTQFEAAFADRMGVTLAVYEEQFFELMDSYLPERSVPAIFTPVGLMVMSAMVIGAALAVSVWSIRTSADITTEPRDIGVGRSSQSRTIGFMIWVATVAILSLGVFVIGTYEVSVSWGLSGIGQVAALATLILYLSVTTFILVRATRSRRQPSTGAWLLPLVAAGGAIPAAIAIGIITTIL